MLEKNIGTPHIACAVKQDNESSPPMMKPCLIETHETTRHGISTDRRQGVRRLQEKYDVMLYRGYTVGFLLWMVVTLCYSLHLSGM